MRDLFNNIPLDLGAGRARGYRYIVAPNVSTQLIICAQEHHLGPKSFIHNIQLKAEKYIK